MDTKGLQQEFISWCKSKKKSPKTEEETKQLFHAFMKEKHPKEYEAAMKQQQQQETQKAAHGIKLQYIKNLKHQCAEDEELYYYKKGGSVGCGCKKKEDGGEMKPKKDCGGGPVAKFKKMRQGGQPKVVNGSTKQPTIQGTAKMQEEFKRKQREKERQRKIDEQSLRDYEEGNNGNSDNPSDSKAMSQGYIKEYESKKKMAGRSQLDHLKCGGEAVKKFKAKCGSKMKKHQQGGSLNGIFFKK